MNTSLIRDAREWQSLEPSLGWFRPVLQREEYQRNLYGISLIDSDPVGLDRTGFRGRIQSDLQPVWPFCLTSMTISSAISELDDNHSGSVPVGRCSEVNSPS